jgi:hypothetical protein
MNREISVVTGDREISGVDERRPEEFRGPQGTVTKPEERAQLFASNEAQDLRSRWEKIQTGFVDEPRKSVQDADGLVAEAIKRLTETFTQERAKLEHEWDRGEDASTEDLRLALRRYRSFFDRLLAV